VSLPWCFLAYPPIRRSPHRGSFDSFLLAGKCRITVVLSLWKWRYLGIDLISSGVGIRIRWVRFAILDLVPMLDDQLDPLAAG
jgi:hypothetical protein